MPKIHWQKLIRITSRTLWTKETQRGIISDSRRDYKLFSELSYLTILPKLPRRKVYLLSWKEDRATHRKKFYSEIHLLSFLKEQE